MPLGSLPAGAGAREGHRTPPKPLQGTHRTDLEDVISSEVKNLIQLRLRYLIERKVNPNNLKPTRNRTIPLKEGVQGEDLAEFYTVTISL